MHDVYHDRRLKESTPPLLRMEALSETDKAPAKAASLRERIDRITAEERSESLMADQSEERARLDPRRESLHRVTADQHRHNARYIAATLRGMRRELELTERSTPRGPLPLDRVLADLREHPTLLDDEPTFRNVVHALLQDAGTMETFRTQRVLEAFLRSRMRQAKLDARERGPQ
jgi:hypothetical protein